MTITQNKIEYWKKSPVYKVFPRIINSLSPEKIQELPFDPVSCENFEEIVTAIEERKPLKRMNMILEGFRFIEQNLQKFYIEVIPETDGTRTFSAEKYRLNMSFDSFLTKSQLERTGCLEICKYMDLRKINRVEKTIRDGVFTRNYISFNEDIEFKLDTNKDNEEVIERLAEHYSELYRTDDKEEAKLALFDLIELLRVRPRDKALWLNITGGFGKDVLITVLASFWNHRIFDQDINDDMNNAPRVRAEREFARTNAEIWSRPELKADANKIDIERRVQSIKTHTGRTSDITEIEGDVRINSAFSIETTNADLQLRNDMDVARRFIVFKMEGSSLLDHLTAKEISKLIDGDYDNELEAYYYEYVKAGLNKQYMKRLKELSTPISEVIDEQTKDARSMVPKTWAKYTYIPKTWYDKVFDKHENELKNMTLKEKVDLLGLGASQTKYVKVIKKDEAKGVEVEGGANFTVRVNKNAKKKTIEPVITILGTFDDDGNFIEIKK